MLNLKIAGKTIDNKIVIKGIFQIQSSIGLALEDMLPMLTKNNMVNDWIDYYDCSVKSGCNKINVMNKITNALEDCFDKNHKREVLERLNFHINKTLT